MHIEIKTTVTSRIVFDEDGTPQGTSHSVDIDATEADGVPTNLIYALAKKGCEVAASGITDPDTKHEVLKVVRD